MVKQLFSHSVGAMLAMQLCVACSSLLFSGTASALNASVSTSTQANVVSLNGTWQFAHAPTEAAAQALADFHQPGFDAKAFQPLPVPSNWALHGFEQPTYKKFAGKQGAQGFYLKRFRMPAGWNDARVLLRFGGVWAAAEVWLNGKHVGNHDSGFTEFAFDITPHIKKGAENVLAVRVRQVYADYEFDTNDDWSLGGIYRDVTLESSPKQRWLDSIGVQTVFDAQFRDAELKVRVMVPDVRKTTVPGNYVGPGNPYSVRLTLLDQAGRTVLSHEVEHQGHAGTSRETSATLHVQRPLHWTAETPNLYNLRVQLIEGGKVTHEKHERVGFRQISWEGGVFRINGQAVKLRGVNRHEEHPDVGRATTREHWIEDIRLMKEANINFIRLAHYPSAKGFIELCDEMGMYVGNEIAMGYGGGAAHNPAYTSAVLLRSYATVARDVNRPSVIFWAVGNEDPLTSLHMGSVQAVKGWDPTRPVLLPWRAESWLPAEIDIMAPHYWTASEYDEFAARSTRPVITTEFTHAYANDGFGGLAERWRALTRHPAGAGGAIWMWADQGLRFQDRKADGSLEKTLKVLPDGWDGIVDSYRKPTRDYWETKAVYAPVYPTISQVGFTPGQDSVVLPIQNDFDFTDLKNIKIEWSVMEDARSLATGNATLAGEPHATASLALPLRAITSVRPGATYSVQLHFVRADGSELTRRSVELLPATAPVSVKRAPVALRVEQGPEVRVHAGPTSFVFDPKSGHLASITHAGKRVLGDFRPTLWRKLNDNETMLAKPGVLAPLPDLNTWRAAAKTWSVTSGEDGVLLRAKVDYLVDAANRFAAEYTYRVAPDGVLQVRYVIAPAVVAPWLPHVGIDMAPAPGLDRLRWLGLGPLDAYPNESTAAILGVWEGALGTSQTTGVKSTRWVELAGAPGTVRIAHHGYLDTASGTAGTVRLLSNVAGRGTKHWAPEAPAPMLPTVAGKTYVGEFSVTVAP